METKAEILELIGQYQQTHSDEKETLAPLIHFISTQEDLISRKNFVGHLTASAFIIDEQAGSLLLLKHRSLNRWLQPGGHIDNTDTSLASAALREAAEETGLPMRKFKLLSNRVFDIDSHHIPENIKKCEPAHIHHDIRFLLQCSNSAAVSISLAEATDSKWVHFSDLTENPDFNWVEEKIENFRATNPGIPVPGSPKV